MSNKYENSGNLFSANTCEVVRKGDVDIGGFDHELMITKTKVKDKSGNQIEIFEGWVKAGGLYVNKEVTEKHGYNLSGEITVGLEKLMMWCYKRLDKNNNSYTRVSVAPAKPKEGSSNSEVETEENAKPPLDDDIPF